MDTLARPRSRNCRKPIADFGRLAHPFAHDQTALHLDGRLRIIALLRFGDELLHRQFELRDSLARALVADHRVFARVGIQLRAVDANCDLAELGEL